MKFIDSLKKINKLYYTTPELAAIGPYSRQSLYVILNRLVKRGQLIRLTPGIYILPEHYGEIERIANMLYSPSYLSFESALAKYGVLSQIPYTLMFATSLKTKRGQLGHYRVEYRKIKNDYFWGYHIARDGLYIATPEKAVFDIYYFTLLGRSVFDFGSLDFRKLDLEKIKIWTHRYLGKDFDVRRFSTNRLR